MSRTSQFRVEMVVSFKKASDSIVAMAATEFQQEEDEAEETDAVTTEAENQDTVQTAETEDSENK